MLFNFAFRFPLTSLCLLWLHFPVSVFSSLVKFTSINTTMPVNHLYPKRNFLVASPIGEANGKHREFSMKSQTMLISARTGFSNLFDSLARQNTLESP